MAALYAVADVLKYQRLNQQSTVLQFYFGAAILISFHGLNTCREEKRNYLCKYGFRRFFC